MAKRDTITKQKEATLEKINKSTDPTINKRTLASFIEKAVAEAGK